MKKLTLILLLLVSCFVLFIVFGRAIWHPVFVKMRGEKTVSDVVKKLREKNAIHFNSDDWSRLVILGLKEERVLEVWGIDAHGGSAKIKEFPFTGFSGNLGPKLREGDGQIPEGVYKVEYLNPNSSFHLSIKIDYPNAYDREQGKKDGRVELGSDIFIHGRSATIGCIPIGDAGIEDLFLMVAEMGKERVEVIIAPYDIRKGVRDLRMSDVAWEEELYSRIAAAIDEKIH